jgi:UPF0716 family protein affecting phage T7 exclusion
MAFPLLLSGRIGRATLLLVAGWLVLEYALMQLVAARIGWGATLAFLSVKGGAGLLLVGFLTVKGLRNLGKTGFSRSGSNLMFSVISGVLITLPGLAPTLVGIALFAPSLRAALLKRFRPAQKREVPRDIDLSEDQWREVRTRRIAKRAKSRAIPASRNAGESKHALETKPPSV